METSAEASDPTESVASEHRGELGTSRFRMAKVKEK